MDLKIMGHFHSKAIYLIGQKRCSIANSVGQSTTVEEVD